MAVNRVEKLIINMETTLPIVCAWDTCDRRARTSHQVRTHEHRPDVRCDDVNSAFGQLGRHVIYAFCSDGHLDYWVSGSGTRVHDQADRYQGRVSGMHSAGNRKIHR